MSSRMVIISLDRNPEAQWATGFGVHGVVGALRTGNDLIWLLQYDASSDCFTLSRCLHPMERCALQGFPAEQLAGMSKAGVLRATGNAMSTPVVAAAFKRLMEVLVARLSIGVPSAIPLQDEGRKRRLIAQDEERKRRRTAITFMRGRIALLEAEVFVLKHMSRQG